MSKSGFNVDLRPTADPSYTGASREPSRQDFKDDSWSTLFSGLGEVISGAAKTADYEIKSRIEKDVYSSVDPIRDAQGVGDAVNSQPDPLNLNNPAAAAKSSAETEARKAAGDIPPNANSVADRVKRLSLAFQEGKITPTNYYAQLEAESRAIRARYPGYREEVDKMIQAVTGINPANALVRSIQTELEAARGAEDRKAEDDMKFLRQNAQYLPADIQREVSEGRVRDVSSAKQYIFERQSEDYSVATAKSRLDFDAAMGKATKEQATQVASESLNTYWNRLFSSQGDVGKLVDGLIRASRDGKSLSPQELQQFKAEFQLLKKKAEEETYALLDTPGSNSKMSIGTLMGDDKFKFMREYLGRFDNVEKAITDGNFGVVAINANIAKAMQDRSTRTMLENNPVLQNLDAIGRLNGAKEWISIVAMRPESTIANDATRAVTQALRINRGAEGGSVGRDIDDLIKNKSKTPGALRMYFRDLVDDLSNPTTPKEVTVNSIRSMFNESNRGFISRFTPEERINVFTQLTKPEVTKRILDTVGKDSEEWKNYSTWSKQTFFNVFKQTGDAVNGVVDRRYVNVRFDEKANQFTVEPTPEGVAYASKNFGNGNPVSWLESNVMQSNFQAQVDKMNRGIKMLEPIMKAEGYDVGTEMGALLKMAGVGASTEKSRTIWGMMVSAWERQFRKPMTQEDRDAENPLTFGGSNVNFPRASGGDDSRGGLSLENSFSGKLLGFISGAEGASYDTVFGGGKLPKPAAETTINELIQYQDRKAKEGAVSTVAGAYQFHRNTLRSLVKELGLTGEEKMTKEMQDNLAQVLLERRGIREWKTGRIATSQFMDNLAQEWAALPTSRTGMSHYHGDGINKATRTKQQLVQFLESLRQEN